MISKSIVDGWVGLPKSVVRPMAWTKKLNGNEPCWHMFESAVEVTDGQQGGIIPEGLRIICMWRAGVGELPPIYALGLFVGGERVYAIDVNRIGFHTNGKAGRGRPLYGKKIGNVHEHTWSDDGGYGYAEPLTLDLVAGFEDAWKLFCERAKLDYQHGFCDPSGTSGQRLLL